ncbi:MAG: UDP-3-O-acyl-N-acetylglucosamine deacetylase [Candidatus Obscuribacterales bacterium]|nr:UDP-3-O-acyl-N-acetylglucosamine deacetylase [Candidatus Obscuribacterales bacterium]
MSTSIGLPEIVYQGKGLTSRQNISVKISRQEKGHGIIFRIPDKKNEGAFLDIPAIASSVINTMRNVTLGVGPNRLCLVEHILCAVAVWGLEDLLIEVDGPEIPLGDGSAMFWMDLLESSGWNRVEITSDIELKEPIILKKGDRVLMAIPDDKFSSNYMMDWDHPMIGKCWQSWTAAQNPRDICDARTFGSEKEHMMLGIADDVVSMTTEGFSKELRWTDEPVRHKLLDLVGDLVLAGVNPMRWKARFISIKGGHEMDVEMSKRLSALL